MVFFIIILHLNFLHQNLIVKTFEVHHYVSKVANIWVPFYIVIHHFKSMLDFILGTIKELHDTDKIVRVEMSCGNPN